MQATQPLLPLKPLHLPTAIGWWPPAPGWYGLAALLLIILLLLVVWQWRRQAQQRYWRLAIKKLNQLKLQQSTAATVGDLAYLLKQMAMLYFAPQQPAKLTGTQWLQFLDKTTEFKGFEQQGGALIEYAYQPPHHPVPQLATLIDLSETWINHLKKYPLHKGRM